MSSRPTEPRSIASQLVFLFTLAAALLLCAGLGVLYWIVVRHAFEEDNDVLADKISAVRADLVNAGGAQALREELKFQRAGERTSYWIRVLDSDGKPAAETTGMARLLPANVFPAPPGSAEEMTEPRNFRAGGKLFALVATTEQSGGQPQIIQVAQDRSEDEQFTRDFGILFFVVLAAGIGAAGVIAITVTKRGLRPVAEMTRALKLTGPTHLHERIAPAGWPRELQPLAIAFDEMLDRLEDSFTRLSQFSADLAHELRTPISNLRGEAEVALTRMRSPEEYREVMESSLAECARLSAIIDNLLFLARAEAAQGLAQRTHFDARAAMEKIAAYYETLAEEHEVAITCTGSAEIYADAQLFGRAVSNLVENALRFTPPHGNICIALKSEPAAVEISVRDDGRGMEETHLPRVFDRFYRAEASRSSQGTGLGLALVKSIAELHGGSAAITSEVGRGTVVTLRLPQ